MLDTIERPSTDKITEPAKRWRNKWRARITGPTNIGKVLVERGEVYWGATLHPSKDVAESWAAATPGCSEHLGAFPVSE